MGEAVGAAVGLGGEGVGSSAVVAVTGDDDDDDEGCATNGRKIEEAVIVSSECIDGGKIVDDGYISHRVCSTDTFQGLCLKYKVAPTTLRQLNRFSGSNLSSAPTTLIIPKGTFTKGTLSPSKSAGQDPEEQNIHRFLHALKIFLIGLGPTGRKTTVGRKEAIAHLHMHDGNLEDSIQEAKDSTLVNEVAHRLQVWVTIHDVRVHLDQHVKRGLVHLHEHTVVHLQKPQHLQDMPRLRVDAVDAPKAHHEEHLLL